MWRAPGSENPDPGHPDLWKGWGGSWLGLGVGGFLGSEPGVEVGGRQDAQGGEHAVVAEAADLGAEDGVVAGSLGGEVDVGGLAGDGVLLDAHLGDRRSRG